MAKAATKKTPKSSKVGKSQKALAVKSSRAAPARRVSAAKVAVAKKPAPKASIPAKPRTARAPVISKDELRNQIEKLTTANATLKAKGRETAKALKAAEARVAVLEDQISQTETKVSVSEKPKAKVKSPRKTLARKTVAELAPEVEETEAPEEPADSEIA